MFKSAKVNVKEFGIFFFFIALFIVMSVAANGFLSTDNLLNVARQVSMLGIVAVGMTLVIITGGIDLSVGSVLAASGCLTAFLMVDGQMDPVSASILGILLGGFIGFLNGLMITKINIPPFVATLATMTATRGLAYIITQAKPIYGFPDIFSVLGQGHVGFLPIPVIIMAIVFVIGYFILGKLAIGRHIFAIGGNEEAARLTGINANRVKMFVYTFTGLLAGLAGVVLLSRINTGIPSTGNAFEFEVITAVILGGISIAGGEGKIRGVILGVCIMGILSNGLIILGVQEYWQWVVRGVVFAAAVAFDRNAHVFALGFMKKKAA